MMFTLRCVSEAEQRAGSAVLLVFPARPAAPGREQAPSQSLSP